MDCKHEHIQVIRHKRRYEWSCADCGDEMLTWSDLVWNKLFGDMPELAEGEGFRFTIVTEREEDAKPRWDA